MSFPIEWVPSTTKQSRKVVNQLDRDPNEFYVKTIADRLKEVNKPNNQGIHDAVEDYYKLGTSFSITQLPQHKMVPIKNILIDEDIQREMDTMHITNILKGFDPRRVNPIFAVKEPNEEIYHCTDGQHTVVTLAKLAQADLIDEVEHEDWDDFEVDVLYVETDDRSFAREHFAFINGVGKKKIDEYDNHKQRVLSYRLDNNNKTEYALSADKQAICEEADVYPIKADDQQNSGIPGTLTHLNAIKTIKPECLKFIVNNHNTFWKTEVVDSAEFSFNKILFQKATVPVDSKEYVEFLHNLNAIIKTFFTNPAQLRTVVSDAYAAYSKDVFGATKSVHDTAVLNVVLKIYVKLGGTFNVPDTVLSHKDNGKDLYDYISPSILKKINKVIKDGKNSA
jgi:hypothetical protein|tara:strand:+ start:299 stop:1480 length:1182 start_codon:yes stop_codon:yes gene_type:complete